MRNLSAEFKEQQNIGNHRYLKFVDITLRNGTELHLDNSNLWSNGFSFDEAVSSDNNFDIGSAIINKFSVVINNIEEQFSDYVFAGATAVVYAGLELSTGVEKIRICTGVVSEEPKQKSSIITLSFLDNMSKFDKDYSGVKTVFPATRNQIVRDICSHCGVTLQTVNFDNDSYIIQSRPDDEALTCRQMLAWVAQIGCQWAKCDTYGRLCIDWYKDILVGEISVNSNGILTINEKDVSGNKTPISLLISSDLAIYPSSGDFEIKDGKLNYKAGIASDRPIDISKMTNMSVDLEDVVITGVKVTEYKEDSSEDNPAKTYMYGKEGYVLSISDNKLITENTGNTITSIIGEKCVGMRFRPFSANCITDIAIEAGDPVAVIDRKGNTFLSYATNVKLQPGSFELISCGAESSERNSAKQYSLLTQAEVAARKNIQKEKTEREKALEELAVRLENSPGVFTTVETDTGGGKIYYLHNKPKLSDSDMVWKMTAEAWAVSTDGGKTWNAGMTVDGDTIVRILTATGINADWINAGEITVKDSNQNIIFSVDMDAKRVIISGDSVQIGGRPVQDVINSGITESKNYSDKKLSDYANTVSKDLESIQAQVDGQVEDFYYDYEPSMQNIPASQWTTTEERQKHIGDRFFWKSKGYAYRFMENGGVWGWVLLQDTDITKAMQAAQNAQDTADGKRRVFVTTPQPPYDIGDLWADGKDILTCVTSRESGALYVSSDWEKRNDYTDDTVANQALEEARKAHNINIELDNDYQGISTDYNGNITEFPLVKTHVTVFYGHEDVSVNCNYSIQKSDSITGSWDNSRRDYTVTGLSADTGWVDITANYMGIFDVTKRFNISKNKGGIPGADGTPGRTYFIEASSNVLKRSKDNTIYPNFIEFKAYYRDGNSATRTPYAGRFIIEETVDGNTWKTIYTSTSNENTVRHQLYSLLATQTGQVIATENGSTIGVPRDVTSVRCKLYASGGTTNLMDMQSVAVIRDADDNLTQEEVFNILTNNGTAQGIFMLNGQLYINMSYLQTGILKLGGVKNGNGQQDIYNNAGDLIGRIDNNGVTFFYEYQESGSGYSYKGVEFSKTGIRYVQEAIFTDDTAVTFETIPVIKFNSNQDGMDGNFDNATIGNAILYNITKMLVSGDAKFSGKPEFSTGLNVIGGNVKFPGWGFNGRFIESLDGNVKLRDKDNIAQLDSKNFRIKYGLDLHLSGQTGSGDDFGDGGKPFNIHGLGTGTGSSIVISGSTVYRTSSSKRYKTIGRNITDEDIEKWYQIQPVWAKYKNEFVTRQSGCFNTVMPMLIAEDVETYIPKAAVKNENGETEDWSERVLIPAMFAMIKSQKNQIDELKRELEIIRKRSK